MPFIELDGRRIEYRMVPGPADRATVVLLHEGLGSAALWRSFPDNLARRLGRPVIAYSRFGYGRSAPHRAPRTPHFMHEEALDVLPRVLHALGIVRPLVVGHSDGASIALIHAAAHADAVAGLVLMAPHAFVEEVTVQSIARITATYKAGELRTRLARHHDNVDDAFLGWANIWLDPVFRDWSLRDEAGRLTLPTLLLQGEDDEYGTLAQVDAIAAAAKGPVRRCILGACGHSPHRDQEAAVLDSIVGFATEFLQD